MYACLYRPSAPSACGHAPHASDSEAWEASASGGGAPRERVGVGPHARAETLAAIAQEFSPRYECHRDDLVSIDVSGLERLFQRRSVLDTPERSACGSSEREGASEASGGGAPRVLENGARALASGGAGSPTRQPRWGAVGAPRSVWKTIGEELRREAASRGVRVHVAVAGTRMAAVILAHARPGVTVVPCGAEADALAPLPINILEKCEVGSLKSDVQTSDFKLQTFSQWGIRTLGELAALPSADLASRLGRQALIWQALARGDDVRPLVPTLEDERFESSLELEWPIEGLEPLSFVLTRLLEPLSTRLERRDRGAAVLHVLLRLVTKDSHARRLELPTPMRDVRTLRTLALLDLESHPPATAIDRVAIVIDPTPGRVLQHTLFTRAQPTPEQLSTLLARLSALMGQDRLGTPAVVDSYRPGAFAMAPFKTEHESNRGTRRERRETSHVSDTDLRRPVLDTREDDGPSASARGRGAPRDVKEDVVSALRRCRQPVPARVAIDNGRPVRVTTDRRGFVGGSVVQCAGPWRTSGEWWVGGTGEDQRRSVLDTPERNGARASGVGVGPRANEKSWNRDEWDVALNDGAVYRIFQDRDTDAWFIDAIVD